MNYEFFIVWFFNVEFSFENLFLDSDFFFQRRTIWVVINVKIHLEGLLFLFVFLKTALFSVEHLVTYGGDRVRMDYSEVI